MSLNFLYLWFYLSMFISVVFNFNWIFLAGFFIISCFIARLLLFPIYGYSSSTINCSIKEIITACSNVENFLSTLNSQ